MQWNLVNDTYPLDMNPVLLYDDVEGICIGYYFKLTNRFIREFDGQILTSVYNWMLLPLEPLNPF